MKIIKSTDGRYRTEAYAYGEDKNFAVFEKIENGVIATEFAMNGEVVDQIYYRDADPLMCLKSFLAEHGLDNNIEIDEREKYMPVEVDAVCPACGKKSICRELDLIEPNMINSVPVVPLYVCRSCGKKYYSLSNAYLDKLVDRNIELFSKGETAELAKDRTGTVKTIQEYVLRIFASKKINRLNIENK